LIGETVISCIAILSIVLAFKGTRTT